MLIHWIWLATRPSLTDRAKVLLLGHFSDPEDIYFADADAFAHIDGLTKAGAEALTDKDLSGAEEILAECARKKLHILTYQDAAYPVRLKHIPDPPLVFYYKGNLPDFNGSPMIGIVGTRKASVYGMKAAKQMGCEVARCGGIVVSGVAGGIDAMAMEGALAAGSPVVGILGCGADVVYPVQNRSLYADTERYGCLMSEFPPGTPPYGRNFPKRNRVISGMSCGVVIVEAPRGSGSLITANLALEQGRDVFVLPGNVDNPNFAGSFDLMRDGGTLVTCGWDVMSEYAAQFPEKIHPDTGGKQLELYPEQARRAARETEKKLDKVAQKPSIPRAKPDKKEKCNKKDVDNASKEAYSDVNKDLPELTAQQRAIVEALGGGERPVDDVIAEVGLPAAQVMSALTMLTIKGIVKKLPGNRIVLK